VSAAKLMVEHRIGAVTAEEGAAMAIQRLTELLDQEGVRYVLLRHPLAYTAQQTSEAAHISGRLMAKTVMVRLDGRMAMVVIPACTRVDLHELALATGAHEVRLAAEAEFQRVFPDSEIGAEPPLGNLYGVPVYISEALTRNDLLAFNAGTHEELIELRYADYDRLVRPTIVRCSVHETAELATR